MKLVIFGLTVSSSWANGHATLWRGLAKALGARGHELVFFEREVASHARHRDLQELPGGKLVLYADWEEVRRRAATQLADADVAMVTSFCHDGVAASELAFSSGCPLRVFYDLDTPVTIARLHDGLPIDSLGPRSLVDYDLVLSASGGKTAELLKTALGARRVAELYPGVDPEFYAPGQPRDEYRCDLSYMGSYAEDRQAALQTLLLETARRSPERSFAIAGAQYPQGGAWAGNVKFLHHLAPADHAALYASSRLTLNVTRMAMAQVGYCPTGRLFEAAACGTAILSDAWPGLDRFFEPGHEILIAHSTEEALEALQRPAAELARIGAAARARVLRQHTALQRAEQLESALDAAFRNLVVRGSDPGFPQVKLPNQDA